MYLVPIPGTPYFVGEVVLGTLGIGTSGNYFKLGRAW